MKKVELDKFLQKSSKRKENIFTKYRDEIFYMREQKATLATIINYLMTVDEEIKSRYADNENAGISFLSYSIKRFNGKEELKNRGNNNNNNNNEEPEPEQPEPNNDSSKGEELLDLEVIKANLTTVNETDEEPQKELTLLEKAKQNQRK